MPTCATGSRLTRRGKLTCRKATSASTGATDVTSAIERAHEAWADDRYLEAAQIYDSVLEATGATGDDHGSLPPQEHLQCHANLGASYMHLAEVQGQDVFSDLDRREKLLTASLRHWHVAERCGPASPLLDFFLSSVSRNLELAKASAQLARQMDVSVAGGLKVEPIARRSARDLSYSEFVEEYVAKGVPVVITGLAVPDWDLDLLEAACGDREVPRVRHDPSSAGSDWAALASAHGPGEERIPLRDHLQTLRSGSAAGSGAPMLFDHALAEVCPRLLEGLTIPKFFAVDYLRTIPETARSDIWPAPGRFPSLFAQPAGTQCGLHVDQAGTHFYQMLISGRKRWRVFRPEESPRLYPRGHGLLFEADTFQPDLGRFPLLGTARAAEAILEPGETIFVPQGSPHQVRNEEASVAVSSNYVAGAGLETTLAELDFLSQGGTRPEYARAAEALRRWAPAPGSAPSPDPGDLRWHDFDRASWMDPASRS